MADDKGLPPDEAGANLPRDYAPWCAAADKPTLIVSDGEPIAAAVRENGFFLVSGDFKCKRPDPVGAEVQQQKVLPTSLKSPVGMSQDDQDRMLIRTPRRIN